MKKKYKTKKKDLWFCLSILAIPFVHFLIFYLGVNFNSILLSLKSYTYLADGTAEYAFVGLSNYVEVFEKLFNSQEYLFAVRNSLYAFLLQCVVTVLSILFAYYIYKKAAFSKTIKLMLFMPAIISPLILSLIFRYFVDSAIPNLFTMMYPEGNENISQALFHGLFQTSETRMGTILFFSLFVSFSKVIIYCGAMEEINPAIIEAGKIDGANPMQELRYIVFPMIYKTFVSMFTISMATLFTNQLNLISFYQTYAPYEVSTVGYKLTVGALEQDLTRYPFFSALGVVCSIVTFLLITLVRKGLNKLDRMEN